MEDLVKIIIAPHIKGVLMKRKEEFKLLPLKEWLAKLENS